MSSLSNRIQSDLQIAGRFDQAICEIERLLRHLRIEELDVVPAKLALNALPIPSSEFAQLQNRLNSACHYASVAESGASQYELRLLAANLRSLHKRHG